MEEAKSAKSGKTVFFSIGSQGSLNSGHDDFNFSYGSQEEPKDAVPEQSTSLYKNASWTRVFCPRTETH
jgi:hypothetical protein